MLGSFLRALIRLSAPSVLGGLEPTRLSNQPALLPKKKRSDPRQRFLFGSDLPHTPFWQARFYDFNVFTEKKRIEKLRYIHRNPVKRGLVDRVTDWEWSSARHYWLGEDGVVKVAVPVRWLGSVRALHE